MKPMRRILAALTAFFALALSVSSLEAQAPIAAAPIGAPGDTHKVFVPGLKKFVFFNGRQRMKKGHPIKRATPLRDVIVLPINNYGTLKMPMYDNDQFGDCMWAAAGHAQGTFTGMVNPAQEILFSDPAFINKYSQLSGGDNGLDEGMLISGWKSGIPGAPAGSAPQTIVTTLDVDPTNGALMQQAIYYFGGVLFMLDVPDAWINNFQADGSGVWDAPARADQNNGHGTWIDGALTTTSYHLQTWGSSVTITSAGIKACDPSGFMVWSNNWFNAQGYAPNGLHYVALQPIWIQMGGNDPGPSPFPPPAPTPPTPVPVPSPAPVPVPVPSPTPTPVTGAVTLTLSSGLTAGTYAVVPSDSVIITGDMSIRDFMGALNAAALQPPSSKTLRTAPIAPPVVAVPTYADPVLSYSTYTTYTTAAGTVVCGPNGCQVQPPQPGLFRRRR